MLQESQRSPYAAEFVSSLSIGGIDGTTRGRYDRRAGNGLTHVKTGRLDHVFAMAGFVRSAANRDFVVVAIQNSYDAHRGAGEEAQAALLRWIYGQ